MGSKGGKLAILMGFLPSNNDASVQLKKLNSNMPALSFTTLFHVGTFSSMLEVVASKIPASSLAVHCHDTYGQALSNILTSLQVSI
jgi:hypothetical protein